MDFISHGLWGGITAGRRSRKSFWLAFAIGMAPDVIAFGPFFALTLLGLAPRPEFRIEPPQDNLIPNFVHLLYSYTHSLVIFALVFALFWLLLRRPVYEMLAWPLHTIMDIFTHSDAFFPTPFLFPLSNYHYSGIPWDRPIIFIPNVLLLIALYVWFYTRKKKKKLMSNMKKSEKVYT